MIKKIVIYIIFFLNKSYYFKKLCSQNSNKEAEFLDLCVSSLKHKNFFEIGFGPNEFNCSNLVKKKYSGHLVDGDKKNCQIMSILSKIHKLNLKIHNIFLTKDNIREVITESSGGIFSIDVDGNDYWILKEVLNCNTNFEIIIVEYNSSFKERCVSIPYQKNFERHKAHKSGWYHGASLNAFIKLLNSHNYYLIKTIAGVNAFFVHKDNFEKLSFKDLKFEDAYEENVLRNQWSKTDANHQYRTIQHLPLIEV
tara:strand:+ start:187 stop:945 length:759 start_codon:yes stop_codon:yes gene_type:complete